MNENIRLLMEETGCDQGEAELALELSNHDLHIAIKTIGSLLRHITAVKGKFYLPKKNLYGLILLVLNTKTSQTLRLRTVVSYNPAIYENSPTMDWYAFEKQIFSYRLDEGSLPDYTQNIEQKLETFFNEKKEVLVKGDTESISGLIVDFIAPEEIVLELNVEELNLDQFRKLPDGGLDNNEKVVLYDKEVGTVCLQIDLIEDVLGREVDKIKEGETVLSVITDPRDIAHYLAHLIGNIQDGKMLPLPAVVRKVSANGGESEVHVGYAPGIIGIAKVKNDMKVRILEEKAQSWWKKIISWS
jgi:hypothetical protein